MNFVKNFMKNTCQLVINKAKGQISKRVFQESKARPGTRLFGNFNFLLSYKLFQKSYEKDNFLRWIFKFPLNFYCFSKFKYVTTLESKMAALSNIYQNLRKNAFSLLTISRLNKYDIFFPRSVQHVKSFKS